MSKEGRNPRIKNFEKRTKSVDNEGKNGYNKSVKWKNRLTLKKLQVSPSGMAAASQAVPGEFDSRHLLQKIDKFRQETCRFLFKPKGLVCNHGLPCMELP